MAILTFSLFRYQIKRKRRETERKALRQEAARLAAQAEQKRQVQTGQKVKTHRSTDRVPLSESGQDTFVGAMPPKQVLKWELEIDEIGRRMLGQLDSKMSALQAMILESNRIAQRMEILVETLEKYKKNENKESKSENAAERIPFVFSELEAGLDERVPRDAQSVLADKPLPVAVLREAEKEPASTQPTSSSGVGSTFDSVFSEKNHSFRPVPLASEIKKQIRMLANYQYEPRQIAQMLNITVGEVDLALSIQE